MGQSLIQISTAKILVLINLGGTNITSTDEIVPLHPPPHTEKLKSPPAMQTWSCSGCTYSCFHLVGSFGIKALRNN